MDKMFKRTLLGAAVALGAMGVANAAQLTDNVQLYGQAAGNLVYESKKASSTDDTLWVDLESRIGLRGKQEFNNFGPNFVWQIESGNTNFRDVSWDSKVGTLGGRDTYLGLEFEDVGTIKIGRQLVSTYDYVDWPHSNPGLGNVFDWNDGLGAGGKSSWAFQDRADDVIRFDSANNGGFIYSLSASKMGSSTKERVISIAAAYNGDGFGVHGGVYLGEDDAAGANKASYYLLGGNYSFTDKVSMTAAWKHMKLDNAQGSGLDKKQDAFSATLSYWASSEWLYKLGYAQLTKAKEDGSTIKDSDSKAITARALYVLDPSAVFYFDIRHYDMFGSTEADDQTRFLAGVEYYF